MADLLVIEHRDGRQYAVPATAYKKTYESEGFKAVAYESGKPYEPPKPASTSQVAPKTSPAKKAATGETVPARPASTPEATA